MAADDGSHYGLIIPEYTVVQRTTIGVEINSKHDFYTKNF